MKKQQLPRVKRLKQEFKKLQEYWSQKAKEKGIFTEKDLELLEAIEDQFDLDIARKALTEAEKKGTVKWPSLKSKLRL